MSEQEFDRPLILLVEGSSDRGVFETLLERSARHDVRVIEYGGKTRLGARLRAVALDDEFRERCRWLGIVRDADDDEAATVQSIRSALANADLPSPAADQLSIGGPPAVQIIVLPGGGGPGELEDVIWQAVVGTNANAATCVDGFLGCMRSTGTVVSDVAKARVYSYVAATTRPDRPLSATARATDSPLPLDSPVFRRLLDLFPRGDEPR